MLTNVRSYLPKRETVEALLEDNSTDLAIFTESWLNPDIQDNELLSAKSSYCIHRQDRLGRRGGGVVALVKPSLPSSRIDAECRHEILCVNLTFPTSKTVLIACYRAPDSDDNFTQELYSVVLDLTSRFPRSNFLLCGDFNFPDIDWVHLAAHSPLSRNFLDLCLMFNFAQMVTMPTRGTNILDLFLVSTPDLVNSVQCVDGISDHKILLIGLSIPIPTRQPLNKYIRDYNKANFFQN